MTVAANTTPIAYQSPSNRRQKERLANAVSRMTIHLFRRGVEMMILICSHAVARGISRNDKRLNAVTVCRFMPFVWVCPTRL